MGRGVFLVLGIALIGCSESESSSSTPAREPTTLIVGVPEGNTAGQDAGFRQFVRFLNFESLTLAGTDGRALPRLAERWRWDDNDLTLRIDLRPSVFLHDGTPFVGQTAADLVREAVTDEENLTQYPSFADIDTVTAPSAFELVIHLKRPSAMLPEDLTVQIGVGRKNAGSGPFRTVSEVPGGPQIPKGTEIVLERFDQYYLGKPAIDRVVVRPFESLRASWAALLRGELDMLYDASAEAVDFIRNDDVQVISVPRWYQYHLAFNSRHRVLKSPLVRKALNIAVNRDTIVKKVLHGAGEASSGPIYTKHWAYDQTQAQYHYDPAAAATLLDAAGYPLPTSSTGNGPRARFSFTCLVPQNYAVWERVALEIQRDLFNVGVDMQFKSVPITDYGPLLRRGEFDAVIGDMISGPTPPRAFVWWRSARHFKGGMNTFGYENGEAERLFESLPRSTNEALTRSTVSKLQRVLHDDPPAIFIAWSTRIRAINKRFILPGTSRDPLVTISQWTLAPSS
jgi:peptide/nickel transport system substrate-binding protein